MDKLTEGRVPITQYKESMVNSKCLRDEDLVIAQQRESLQFGNANG